MIEITEALLVELAGPGAYERGVGYFADSRVISIESNSQRTVAKVLGTYPYEVHLKHSERHLDGSCECPASEGIVFCKHCVAVALALRTNDVGDDYRLTDDDDKTIRSYFSTQSRDALASTLISILPEQPELREQLLLQAELAAGSIPAQRLKKAITAVTRSKALWDYDEVAEYFERIEATLWTVASVAEQLPADALLEIALHGMKRLDIALERVDDSGGYRFRAREMLCELHATALRGLDWSPERRAKHLLDLTLADSGDQFNAVPDVYAQALGNEGLAAFYAEVEARLDALPPLRRGASFERRYPHLRLAAFLKDHAESNEDWDALIALEKRTATDHRDYRRIAELYLRKEDPAAAAEWLTKADSFSKGDRSAVATLWVSVHAARCDWDAAVAAQMDVFSRDPSYSEFLHLEELATRAGRVDEIREETKTWLRTTGDPPSWKAPDRAYTLAQILRDEEDWEGSCEAMIGHVDNPNRLLEAARWLAKPAPASASELFKRAIEALIDMKKNRAYRDAVRSLKEAKPTFDAVSPDELAGFVAQLRETHKRKRNLMALLDQLPWA